MVVHLLTTEHEGHRITALPTDRVTRVEEHPPRATAFNKGPGPLFIGKGTDAILTDVLTQDGWATSEHTLATWRRTRTASEILAPLADRAWPYLHQVTPEQHNAGMTAACTAATRTAGPEGRLGASYRLYALVTQIGETRRDRPRVAHRP